MIFFYLYSITSVVVVSFISLIGIFAFSIKEKFLKEILVYFVSLSAGVLFGEVFLHLLPEAVGERGLLLSTSLFILLGIVLSFSVEKIICWRHCHLPITKNHIHRFAYMNLFGDLIHNFIDGLIIASAYLANLKIGLATTLAIVFHEIPQEIGDFGVLLHGGFSKKKALFYNFLTALSAIIGAILALILYSFTKQINDFLLPFASGTFLYIAGSDLIPELHKEVSLKKGLWQLTSFILGISIMLILKYFG